MGSGESPPALATCLTDLAGKWLKECGEVVDEVIEKQLLRALPDEVRVWVSERKPNTSTAVGRLAEDYLQTKRQLISVSREASRKMERPSEGPMKCVSLCEGMSEKYHLDMAEQCLGSKRRGRGERARC